ncbi:MAG: futalosine hydrolase [Actinobacteria bacterium]|nr:futalosine hydrolase [Actinomycetota bacterium]
MRAISLTKRVAVAGKEISVGRLPAADETETEAGIDLVVAISGCDKANAAHLLTCLLQAMEPAPRLVLQVGIAGALPSVGSPGGARTGDLVIATKEIYADTGSSSPMGWLSAQEIGVPIAEIDGRESGNTFDIDSGLVGAAHSLLLRAHPANPRIFKGPCVTLSRISGLESEGEELAGRWGALAESMEGAAAAHICALYRVPFLELRGISNMVTDRDRSSWKVEEAAKAAAEAALLLCRSLRV